MSAPISAAVVAHIALLANLEVTGQEQQQFAVAFQSTMDEVDKLNTVDVQNVPPTDHVTGLVNVWREDRVDLERQLSQPLALSQAKHTLRGHVVVDRILEENT
jgi:aspartyl-tRNA(Asn)/glutamyl-tRNA(Gln) amidotransferase subunit C